MSAVLDESLWPADAMQHCNSLHACSEVLVPLRQHTRVLAGMVQFRQHITSSSTREGAASSTDVFISSFGVTAGILASRGLVRRGTGSLYRGFIGSI